MNSYQELKKKHQKEFNLFPIFFAFSNEQFDEGMRNLGLEPNDTNAIYRLGDTGGFYRKTDRLAFSEMRNRHDAEMKAAIDADTTGEGFIFDMFDYELSNHEYCYTGDLTDTLQALDLTKDDINASAKLKHGLQKAIKNQFNKC